MVSDSVCSVIMVPSFRVIEFKSVSFGKVKDMTADRPQLSTSKLHIAWRLYHNRPLFRMKSMHKQLLQADTIQTGQRSILTINSRLLELSELPGNFNTLAIRKESWILEENFVVFGR